MFSKKGPRNGMRLGNTTPCCALVNSAAARMTEPHPPASCYRRVEVPRHCHSSRRQLESNQTSREQSKNHFHGCDPPVWQPRDTSPPTVAVAAGCCVLCTHSLCPAWPLPFPCSSEPGFSGPLHQRGSQGNASYSPAWSPALPDLEELTLPSVRRGLERAWHLDVLSVCLEP